MSALSSEFQSSSSCFVPPVLRKIEPIDITESIACMVQLYATCLDYLHKVFIFRSSIIGKYAPKRKRAIFSPFFLSFFHLCYRQLDGDFC